MKLISLNAWGGRLISELLSFLEIHADSTDVFCLQEVFKNAANAQQALPGIDPNLFDTLSTTLVNHHGFFAPSQEYDEGLAIFVKTHLKEVHVGSTFVHRDLNAMVDNDRKTLGRNIQYATFKTVDGEYTIFNFHGLWTGGGKADTPERLVQSEKIKQVLANVKMRYILVGDFNLNPDTVSMAILETGARNLVRDLGVTTTRSRYHGKTPEVPDYILVSEDLKVNSFEVLHDAVSDHLPLLLDFN